MHSFSKARHTKLVIHNNLKFDRPLRLKEKVVSLLYWSPNKQDNSTLIICLLLLPLRRNNKRTHCKGIPDTDATPTYKYQPLLQIYEGTSLCLSNHHYSFKEGFHIFWVSTLNNLLLSLMAVSNKMHLWSQSHMHMEEERN